jgi:rare lipoprotein A
MAMLAVGFASCLGVSGSSAFAGSECGVASWYGLGGLTASGEDIVQGGLTAAHRTLRFGTLVKVENLGNGRAVVVRINDRGPFVPGRALDLTRAGAERLGFLDDGVARVRMTVVGGDPTGLTGSCGTAANKNRQAVAALVVPLPRERSETSFSARFGYAFLPADQTQGTRSVARLLGVRSVDLSRRAFADATSITPNRETSFAALFADAFLPADQTPGAVSVARGLSIPASTAVAVLASVQ